MYRRGRHKVVHNVDYVLGKLLQLFNKRFRQITRLQQRIGNPVALATQLRQQELVVVRGRIKCGQLAHRCESGQYRKLERGIEFVRSVDGEERRVQNLGEPLQSLVVSGDVTRF